MFNTVFIKVKNRHYNVIIIIFIIIVASIA